MPTNNERRWVAANLRNYENLRESFRESPIYGFHHALGVGCFDWNDVCERLADLIEPKERTCRKIRKNDPTHKGNWNFHCSICNCYLRGTDEYCSYCGARVVE